MKFGISENSFVKVGSHGGQVMMVIAAKDGLVPRYDLQALDGTTYRNLGEYELTRASDDEVSACLNKAP